MTTNIKRSHTWAVVYGTDPVMPFSYHRCWVAARLAARHRTRLGRRRRYPVGAYRVARTAQLPETARP